MPISFRIATLFLLLLFFSSCLVYPGPLPGKCDKEKKKRRACVLQNFIACELSYVKNSYTNIDICTNPDGFLFALPALCDGFISEECQSSSSSGSE